MNRHFAPTGLTAAAIRRWFFRNPYYGVSAVMFLIWPPIGFAQDNIGMIRVRKGHM